MINRIRDIRREKGLTLADVAARCSPPTTAQTIGRLETGTRNLSLVWMNRIAAALGVEADLLVRGDARATARVIARMVEGGTEALTVPRDAILPNELASEAPRMVLDVEHGQGDYRSGDQVWLRQVQIDDFARFLNRDALVPRPGGRFAFGRVIDRDPQRVAVLPPGPGQRQIIIDNPPWLAVAEMLVRRL